MKKLPEQLEGIFNTLSPLSALSSLFEHELQACQQQSNRRPNLLLEFISQRRDEAVKGKLSDSFSNLFASTAEIIKKLQEQNHLSSDYDPYTLSVIMHGLMNGIVLMSIVAPNNVPLNTVADEAAKVVWNGVSQEHAI